MNPKQNINRKQTNCKGMTPLEFVLSKLPGATKCGEGWQVRCPAHEDKKPSLTINEGEDGNALLHCHAGCKTPAICRAMRIREADLFPKNLKPSPVYGIGKKSERERNTVDKSKTKRNNPTFATDREAVAALVRRHGKPSADWAYHDAKGRVVGRVVRWEGTDGKDILPAARIGDRWQIGGMPVPRPLYGLTKVMKATMVFVCEGEKTADAVRSLSLTATTSAHGAKAADKTDWTPLAGKQVVILPDNDEPGRQYARDVVAKLGVLSPRPTVKIVELPNLPEGGDAVEWIAAQDNRKPEKIRTELERLADQAEAIESERPAEPLRFVPFPVDAMPNPIRGIVRRAASALGCDESFVVLPLVTALAAAIGNTRRLRLKPGWDVPPIIWAVIVAPSGTVKSPAIDIARKPVEKRQRQAMKQYKEVAKAYEAEQKDAKDCNQSDKPIANRYWCDDVTMEALVVRLQEQPRGMLVIRDELSGWFGGFDRYVGGKGGDAPKWLEAYGGRPMLVDRKSGEAIHVPRAAVCVTGSIQPAILKRSLSTTYRENGMAARMLFAFPPRREKRWTDRGIEPRDHETIASIFDHLYDLKFATDAEGEPEPIVIQPTDEAKALFVTYFDAHNGEAADLSDDLGAAWSKLEEYAARLALVVHYVRWAINDKALNDELRLDAVSMKAGIQLAQWFTQEARRIYAMLDEGSDDADRRKLIEWIERRGGRVTAREVRQGNRRYATTDDAEKALIELVEFGYGQWETAAPRRRGQPTRRFILPTPSTVYGKSIAPDKKPNTVDVDTLNGAMGKQGSGGVKRKFVIKKKRSV